MNSTLIRVNPRSIRIEGCALDGSLVSPKEYSFSVLGALDVVINDSVVPISSLSILEFLGERYLLGDLTGLSQIEDVSGYGHKFVLTWFLDREINGLVFKLAETAKFGNYIGTRYCVIKTN